MRGLTIYISIVQIEKELNIFIVSNYAFFIHGLLGNTEINMSAFKEKFDTIRDSPIF